MKTDLINIIEEISNLHPYKQRGNRDSYSEYNEGWSDACDIINQRIEAYLSNIKSDEPLKLVQI